MSEEKKYILFLDSISRLIVAVKVAETEDAIRVQNPLIVHADVNPQGGFSVQFFPIMLRDFQASKNDPTVWTYLKKNIAIADDMVLDLRLTSQYEKIFEPIKKVLPEVQSGAQQPPQQQPQSQQPPKVIKLFDEA